jgi:hypothetical protein
VNETGVWSAPGGKYKKFCSTSTDLALSWNYELGTLSFKGKVGDILKTLLTNICTDGKISSTKDRTLTDCDIPTKDKSLHDSQITPATSRTGVDSDSSEHKCETLSPVTDSSTIEQLQEFIDISYQKSLVHEISFAQAIDNSTPLKSQPDCSLDTLQDQFSVFRQDMESKVLILLTKISEQTQIINKNNQELCKLTKDNLHLKSRLTQLEKKLSPKGNATIPINPDNNVIYITPQTNPQFTEPEVTKSIVTQPDVTLGSFPPYPSEKREEKTTSSSTNLKEKARVPCPFLKKRGHCLKGDRCDFSHNFTPLHECRSKPKQNPSGKFYSPRIPYPNNNPPVPPFPFNSFEPFPPSNLQYPNGYLPPFPSNPNYFPPFRYPTFGPLLKPYQYQRSYPRPLMTIPTRAPFQ